MSEINPDNELLTRMRDDELWMKICAMQMVAAGKDEMRFGLYHVKKLADKFKGEQPAVVIDVVNKNTLDEEFRLRLVPMSTALRLARQEGENV